MFVLAADRLRLLLSASDNIKEKIPTKIKLFVRMTFQPSRQNKKVGSVQTSDSSANCLIVGTFNSCDCYVCFALNSGCVAVAQIHQTPFTETVILTVIKTHYELIKTPQNNH